MPDIVLTTLNAKWIHAAFGLRYLLANLGELAPRARILEFTLQERPLDVVEKVLAQRPRIVGLGVSIWNARESLAVARALKQVAPEVVLVLGGPEVSHETAAQEITQVADHVIQGEADLAFAELCRARLSGSVPPRIVAAPLPDLAQVALPYELYDATDVAHRIVYVEASRGCPFTCEFCLSSLDVPVRRFPLPAFLAALARLHARGVRHFKFVDRTFNLEVATASAILEFFLERLGDGLFLHFEMIPDRLPEPLQALIARFPPGVLQFEIGVQTLDPATSARISRRQDPARLAANFRWLREHTGVHIHADLIAGLPGEDLASFARGFDALLALRPHEIQVGILKRLRGTPICRHDAAWQMVYASEPPYEILSTRCLTFAELQQLRRFARAWDLVVNSGHFVSTAPRLWAAGTPFARFLAFSEWLHAKAGALHGIALHRLSELLIEYLGAEAAPDVRRDYERAQVTRAAARTATRQARHEGARAGFSTRDR